MKGWFVCLFVCLLRAFHVFSRIGHYEGPTTKVQQNVNVKVHSLFAQWGGKKTSSLQIPANNKILPLLELAGQGGGGGGGRFLHIKGYTNQVSVQASNSHGQECDACATPFGSPLPGRLLNSTKHCWYFGQSNSLQMKNIGRWHCDAKKVQQLHNERGCRTAT